ncbi:MAG TPA: heme exporter protein CcmD [Xanthomonadales bacterium]|nr:heme exporter protein CcmD [Xanthomonadales bacterium]
MFEHSVYIAAAYSVTTLVLAWCALAPVLRAKKVRSQIARVVTRTGVDNKQ